MSEAKKGTEVKKWDEVNGAASVEFKELPGFDSGRNPLRGIEDMVEQNDNQLDGVINNVPAETVAEKEAKSSVIEKLKATAPEKHCSKCHRSNDREAR